MSKRAVVLAGGKGTRLRPYTVVLPKPLMPIGDYPILEVIIRQLAYYQFDHVTLAVNHQADLIKTFFGNGEKWGIKIDYSLEHKPLSTMAPLKLIPDLPDNFLIMNGDVLTDLDFNSFMEAHILANNIFTIASSEREQKSEYGVLELNKVNRLVGFKEKPVLKYNVSMGVYAASKEILSYIPADEIYGFDHLMSDLINDNNFAAVMKQNCYWLDIGRPDDYMKAIKEFDLLKARFLR
ncbi:NDP-sugar pyrophosphorylase family protein [Sporomusaceae bacterium BoRhaA]|uniref:nucleotidyltransferase family protein n=1 Tax=Pelorhabdus rhamnosifermentans TaxID=2772457 RepID=UPI001C0639AA|nr:sugar phosphate nucleotidyltransferase [Pelorhabdus rhamnosifermentans]MBU2699166.1 NDP-sugar pyrophosphorylase family protein [Pelorhabdus rhamnosifermentans]